MKTLKRFNSEAGPGEQNDAQFVYMLLEAIWGFDELKRRSVTGKPSNAFHQENPFPGLEQEKLEFIYGKVSLSYMHAWHIQTFYGFHNIIYYKKNSVDILI